MKKALFIVFLSSVFLGSCEIASRNNQETISVTSVSLNKNSVDLSMNDSETLVVEVLPHNADNKDVIWSSSDKSIVSVNDNGVITRNATGIATILVSSIDGEINDSCIVKEPTIDVTGITIEREKNISRQVGHVEVLKAILEPSNATNKSIIWESSDSEVAEVTDGVVTFKLWRTFGTEVTITAKTPDGEVKGSTSIGVLPNRAPSISDNFIIMNKSVIFFYFDEEVDGNSAENSNNYSITGNTVSKTVLDSTKTRVSVEFVNDFIDDQSYNVEISNVMDLSGKIMASTTKGFISTPPLPLNIDKISISNGEISGLPLAGATGTWVSNNRTHIVYLMPEGLTLNSNNIPAYSSDLNDDGSFDKVVNKLSNYETILTSGKYNLFVLNTLIGQSSAIITVTVP